MMEALNVYGKPLEKCCSDPVTGFHRDGYCQTGERDLGLHVTCAVLTDEFLEYSASKGNDLKTPRPDFSFPGLKAGDKWCLCCSRWIEAYKAGLAPKIDLNATHIKMLDFIDLESLEKYKL